MRYELLSEVASVLRYYQWLEYEFLPFRFNKLIVASKKAIDKARLLNRLRQDIGDCTRCPLHQHRTNLVFGEGNPDTELMFIGEGPGQEEDLQGRPFVGRAGQTLTNLIKKMGLSREDVYIANVVKCRPPMNRAPKPDETEQCIGFLKKQIEIISPKVIITLGDVATKALLNIKEGITAVRGRVYDYQGIKVIPTFHPAYLLRYPSKKRLTWEDAEKALRLLREK